MKMSRSVFSSVVALAAIGVGAALSSPAGATLFCNSPSLPGGGNLALHPVGDRVEIECFTSPGGESAEMISVGTGSTSVSANLLAGTNAQTGGFNSSRALIAGCVASDSTVNGSAVTDTCVGVAFKLLSVID